MSKNVVAIYVKNKNFYFITFFSLLLISAIFAIRNKDIAQAKEMFIAQSDVKTADIAATIEAKIKASYEAIRTVSLIPSVMELENAGQALHKDAIGSIQQIYNNAFLNIQLSEIYVLPNNFNYLNINPLTKKPEEPLAVFDEFITTKSEIGNADSKKKESSVKIPEIESFEYSLFKEQFKIIKQNYSANINFKKLEVPMLSGPEIITCDNTDFTQENLINLDNRNRNGFAFTVPKYNSKGQLNGAVSAVLRTKFLMSLMPSENFGIINSNYKNQIITNPSPDWLNSVSYFSTGKLNPNLVYSKIINLKTADIHQWELWVALPNSFFFNTEIYKKIQTLFWVEFITSIIIILGLYSITYNSFKRKYELAEISKVLLALSDELSSASGQLALSSNAIKISGSHQPRLSAYISTVVNDMHEMTFKSLNTLEELLRTSEKNIQLTSSVCTTFNEHVSPGQNTNQLHLENLKKIYTNAEELQAKIMSIQGTLKEQSLDLTDVTETSELFKQYIKENERLGTVANHIATNLVRNSEDVKKSILELSKITN